MTASGTGWKAALALGAALLASAGGAAPARAQVLNAVLEAEIVTLDPHFTGAYITRTFGYAVFDTLFAMDGDFEPRPQMVREWTRSADGLTWRFTLRDGLKFHDGAPVTAADAVASIKRWGTRSALGGRLLAATASLEADDARSFTLVLRQPYGLVLETLGTASSPGPFIMPERLARTPGTEQVTEIVGSGPFVFRRADHRPGDHMLLRRNPDYVPRAEPASFLAGGKVARVEAVNIRVLPDNATAAAALQAGEVDYMQYAPFDLLPRMERDRRLRVQNFTGPHMFTGHYRLNASAKPFDDPAIRRVLLRLVDQAEVLAGFGLDAKYGRSCDAFFICGSSNESDAGTAALKDPSIEAARAALREARYDGTPVIVLSASDLEAPRVSSEILADRLRRAGFTVELQVMDWASVLARRSQRAGWSVYGVHAAGLDLSSPLTNSVIGFNCTGGPSSGFFCVEPLKPLFEDYARAPDTAARTRVAADIQRVVYGEGMAVPFGQFAQPAAYRAGVEGLVASSVPVFWNLEKR